MYIMYNVYCITQYHWKRKLHAILSCCYVSMNLFARALCNYSILLKHFIVIQCTQKYIHTQTYIGTLTLIHTHRPVCQVRR